MRQKLHLEVKLYGVISIKYEVQSYRDFKGFMKRKLEGVKRMTCNNPECICDPCECTLEDQCVCCEDEIIEYG